MPANDTPLGTGPLMRPGFNRPRSPLYALRSMEHWKRAAQHWWINIFAASISALLIVYGGANLSDGHADRGWWALGFGIVTLIVNAWRTGYWYREKQVIESFTVAPLPR